MKAPKRISVKDVAREAGVSCSTVSRAMNDSPLISAPVRKRIQALAEEMGYVPNLLAQSLQSGLTHSVGVVFPTISDHFFVDVIRGIEDLAQDANFSVFLSTSHNDPERELRVIETFYRRRVDGVILTASRIGSPYAKQLNRIPVPVVLLNSQAMVDYPNFHHVTIDDTLGGKLAVRHLIELGHRRIGYLGVSNRPRSNRRRLQAYREVMRENALPIDESWVLIDQNTQGNDLLDDTRAGQALARRLLRDDVTAVFCYNDRLAIGALLVCQEMNVAVPEEFSVIGYDDLDLSQLVTPPLTTMHQPKYQMGQIAMQDLLELLAGHEIEDSLIEPTLVIRGTCAPPKEHSLSEYSLASSQVE